MNNRVFVIEVLGAESRKTGAFTRGNTLEPYPAECIAGAAEEAGFEAKVLQIGDLTDEQIMAQIIEFDPICIGMTTFTYSFSRARGLASLIKGALPGAITVVGGYHPSINPDCVLGTMIDFAVIGEGEVTFVELLRNIVCKEKTWRDVAGISFEEHGELIVTASRQRVRDLDVLPWAKRVPEYLASARCYGPAYPAPTEQTAVAEVSCSRGCNNACVFCVSSPMWNKAHGISSSHECSVTLRSPKSIAEEVRYLHDTYGVNQLYLTDLTFNHSVERVEAICDALIEEGLHSSHEEDANHLQDSVHWYCLAKVGIDARPAHKMAAAGCSRVGIGVESFSDAQSAAFNKPTRGKGDIRDTLVALDEAGIITRCLLVIGSSGESWETIEETIRGLKVNPVDQIRISYLTPFPGTRLAGLLEEDDYSERNWDKFDTDNPIIKSKLVPEELRKARAYIGREFYGSEEYKERCRGKLKRFPWLRETYRWWAWFLEDSGIADIREVIDIA